MSLAAAALWSLAFVFATERFGDKFAPAANRLAEAAASLAHTAKNGPAQPWLAQAFFGRSEPARGSDSKSKAKPKKALSVTAPRGSRGKEVTIFH